MRNLVSAPQFDNEGNPWMGSGQDGQFLKLTRDGKVIGAVGNGIGIGPVSSSRPATLSLISTTTYTLATPA
jgi:hypothetical protein